MSQGKGAYTYKRISDWLHKSIQDLSGGTNGHVHSFKTLEEFGQKVIAIIFKGRVVDPKEIEDMSEEGTVATVKIGGVSKSIRLICYIPVEGPNAEPFFGSVVVENDFVN